nr:GNAT family N-acetyltransferase [uncultured Brevundimonas sp.]
MIEARALDRDGVNALIRLKVGDDQTRLVSPNAVTIAQAYVEPHAWVRGLWAGGDAVGLVAMIDPRPDDPVNEDDLPEDAAYLWRLMIDSAHQGRGYGRQAVEIAIEQARRWGFAKLCLHLSQEAGNALAFYRRFGFEPTDRVDDGERLLIGPVPPTP